MSRADRLNEYGHWVPAEPLMPAFGVRWEQAMRFRRGRGQGRLRALLGGWRDTRAVDRLAEHANRASAA